MGYGIWKIRLYIVQLCNNISYIFRLSMPRIFGHIWKRKGNLQKPWFSKAIPTQYRLFVVHIHRKPGRDYRNHVPGLRRDKSKSKVSKVTRLWFGYTNILRYSVFSTIYVVCIVKPNVKCCKYFRKLMDSNSQCRAYTSYFTIQKIFSVGEQKTKVN